MTLLPLVPGRPASGTRATVDMSKYTTLTDEQKEKLQQVLEKKKVSCGWSTASLMTWQHSPDGLGN